MRHEILNRLHANHQGIEYTTKFARQTVFWPNIKNHISKQISKCSICLKYAANQANPPMLTHRIPNLPFERVGIDIFELDINEKRRKFLITVDHFSDYFEIDELKDTKSKTIIDVCRKNFSRHGIPLICISDNAPNLISSEFKQFANNWEFTIQTSSPHHQQGNGKTEAAVKIAKVLIKKSLESGEDFYKNLLQLRNSPNKNEFSPVQRIFARRTRCGIPTISRLLTQQIPTGVYQQIEHQRKRAKLYYDKRSKNLPDIVVGDRVMAKINPNSNEWQSARIESQHKPNSYLIRTGDNTLYRRSRVDVKPISKHNNDFYDGATTGDTAIEPAPSCSKQTDKSAFVRDSLTDDTAVTVAASPRSTPNTASLIETSTNGGRPKRNRNIPVKYKDYEC